MLQSSQGFCNHVALREYEYTPEKIGTSCACSKLTTIKTDAAIDTRYGIAANLAFVNVSVDLALLEHVAASIAREEDHGGWLPLLSEMKGVGRTWSFRRLWFSANGNFTIQPLTQPNLS